MTPPPELPSIFPSQEDPGLRPLCTQIVCLKGHRWVPHLLVTECGGCKAPKAVMEMRNCPICNEPGLRATFRLEYISRAMGPSCACKGEPSRGQDHVVEFELDNLDI